MERTGPDITVSVQNPARIDEHNEPEPDVVLTAATDRALRPDDVLLWQTAAWVRSRNQTAALCAG